MEDKLIQVLEKYFGFSHAKYSVERLNALKDTTQPFFKPSAAHLKVSAQLTTLLASRLKVNEVKIKWANDSCFTVHLDGVPYHVRTMVFKI